MPSPGPARRGVSILSGRRETARTKDRSTEAGGFVDEQKGKLRKGVGDVKENLERREDEEKNPSREEP